MIRVETEELNRRFIQLYLDGYRTGFILDRMEGEFGYAVNTLYKKLNIEDLKNEARKVNSEL